MIIGIGTDIMNIEEIEKQISTNKNYKHYVFTHAKTEYCESQINKYQHYAARYAAKEAVMKALGTGWTSGVKWIDIEVLREASQPPVIHLSNKTKTIANNLNVKKIWVSLSHSGDYSIALVILEG